MSDEPTQTPDGLVPAGNRSLATKSSNLVKRGLQLASRIPTLASMSDDDLRTAHFRLVAFKAQLSREDYVQILTYRKELVVRHPEDPDERCCLGGAYNDLDLFDDAIGAYREATNLKPDYAEAWLKLGLCYCEINRLDDAIAAYKQAIKIKPDDATAWGCLGITYGKLGRTDDAIAAYKQAIKINPDSASVWCNLGVAYEELGRTEDEIAAFRQAIHLKPDFAMAWRNLGGAYGKAGRLTDAIAAYQQAIKINPDSAAAWYNLAWCYRLTGNTEAEARARQQEAQLKAKEAAAAELERRKRNRAAYAAALRENKVGIAASTFRLAGSPSVIAGRDPKNPNSSETRQQWMDRTQRWVAQGKAELQAGKRQPLRSLPVIRPGTVSSTNAPATATGSGKETVVGKAPEPPDIHFTCPKCGQSLVVEARGAGVEINCAKCEQRLTVPVPGAVAM